MDKAGISLLLSKLEDLRGEIKGIRDEVRSFEAKLREGYFIYTFETSEIENLLKKYSIRYVKKESVVGDLYEYILNCQEHQFKEIQDRINSTGVKAIATTKRLFNVVVAQEKKKIVEVDVSQTGPVPKDGGEEIITITPPSGKVYRIVHFNFRVDPPSGATSGSHYFYSFFKEYDWRKSIASANATYSSKLNVLSEGVDVYNVIRGTLFSGSIPFVIRYVNGTGAEQTNIREIGILIEEFDER